MKILIASTPATGNGSVNQAMSFGVPLVTAGLTEDKADVNARVAWSGVGINLATNEPTPEALRDAIRTALENPSYRQRASSIADEFGGIDTRSGSFGSSTKSRMLQNRMACGETTR